MNRQHVHSLLNGIPVDPDDAAPVGVFDVIREDIRHISTVQPINSVYIERTTAGYRGVLYSNERPYTFALSGNGFIAKPIEDSTAVITYCAQLEDAERVATSIREARRSDDTQQTFNEQFAMGSDGPSGTAVLEGSPEQIEMHGPNVDFIERIPGTFFPRLQGASRKDGKATGVTVCGGGIVMNKEGKILLVKPTNNYGGYDWTFPKGYPSSDEDSTAATARREVREETGYDVFAKKFIGRFSHNDGGRCDYYECDLDVSKKRKPFDLEETEETKWVSMVEALELLNDDVDVKILAAANQLIPQLLVKGGHSGTMIALMLPKKLAKKLAIKGGEAASSLHVTLAYLGKALSESQKKAAATIVRKLSSSFSTVKATLGGVGRFSASKTSEGKDVVYLSVDSPDLTKLRHRMVDLLDEAGIAVDQMHGYTPHVTLAYIDTKKKTPLERVAPVELSFDDLTLAVAGKKITLPFRLVKALPKMSDDQREAKEKRVGVKPLKAGSKNVGATGKVRYGYPGEKGGDKQSEGSNQAPKAKQTAGGAQQKEEQELPHPDLQPPNPEQAPVVAEHPQQAPTDDARPKNPSHPETPKHTMNVAEFCNATNVQRDTLMKIVTRTQTRDAFVSFMTTHLKPFNTEHGLNNDFYTLLYNVLVGKVPEGQPGNADMQQQQAQKPTLRKAEPDEESEDEEEKIVDAPVGYAPHIVQRPMHKNAHKNPAIEQRKEAAKKEQSTERTDA